MSELKKKLVTNTALAYSIGRSALYFLESKPLPIIRKLFNPELDQEPSDEFQKASEKHLKKLLEEDVRNIAEGIYPQSVLSFEKPQEHVKRLLKIWSDAFMVSYRRSKKQHKKFKGPAKKLLNSVPKYYQRNFHNQTDGYLSEQSADIYDHQVDLLFSGSTDAMRRSLLKPLKEFSKKRSSLKILEIGCGVGSFTKQLVKTFPDAEIVALDISKPYLKKAQKNCRKFHNLSFVNGLGEDLDYKDESFDAVVSVFLFHELPEKIRQEVVRESYRVLKTGGFLGLVDSIQSHDTSDLNFALENFPIVFHEPFYKNYISNPVEALINKVFDVESASVSQHFLAKCVHIEKSL